MEIDPRVTVITGANDVGKSTVLRILHLICLTRQESIIDESSVNNEHLLRNTNWKDDPDIGCTAVFQLAKRTRIGTNLFDRGDLLEVTYHFAPGMAARFVTRHTPAGGRASDLRSHFSFQPALIDISRTEEIRDQIDLKNPNRIERQLLEVAFGTGFEYGVLENLSPSGYERRMEVGEARINAALGQVLPARALMKMRLRSTTTERDQISVFLRDPHEGFTTPGVRGAGVRRIISLLAVLLGSDLQSRYTMILMDEPETSLHADLQHRFRSLLESVAEKDAVQVIYATHSPSMINTTRPWSIRLVERVNQNDLPTAVISNRAVDENYLLVRTSLGISPADSLLYSPLTLIVEGPTEALGLPLLLTKLEKENIPGFEGMKELLNNIHILDATGDSFEHSCRLSKSQNAAAVLFLDGDKRGKPNVRRVQDTHRDVPIVFLPEREEFEDIVPRRDYFAALAEILGVQNDLLAEFEHWQNGAELPDQMVFSKRVSYWLDRQQFDFEPDKPSVMRKAIERASPQEVRVQGLAELVETIKASLEGL